MAATGTRFVLEGALPGFLASVCLFELTVHGDGSLTGTVSPSASDDSVATLLLFGGVAEALPTASDAPPMYAVRFQIGKLSDLPGVVFYIDVEGELSQAVGLRGRWNISGSLGHHDAMDPDRPFHLAHVHNERAVDRPCGDQQVAVYPLTQGSYTLRGATVGDNGYLYRATWTLTLRANGVLEGTSLETDNVPQKCRLEGSWTRSHIKLLMTYVVDGAVGTYVYEGDACGGGLRGRCVNTELPECVDERGNFEFNCCEAVRRWNVDDHCQYPRAFQAAVLTCLLSSLHGERRGIKPLPSLVWREVFSFCGFDWFGRVEREAW